VEATIRPFKREDLAAIQRIERLSFRREAYPAELFLAYHTWYPKTFLVAQLEDKVIGYAIGRVVEERGEVISIAVLPEFRRKGIGTSLWRALREEFQRALVKEVRLHVRVSNEAAINFYQRLGFKKVHKEVAYYSDGEDAWSMRLTFCQKRI